MVLLDIRQGAVGGRVDEDQSQSTLGHEVEDTSLGSVDSVDSKKGAGVETGYWSYSMPFPGVRYYAFYESPKAEANRNPALPKAAPR